MQNLSKIFINGGRQVPAFLDLNFEIATGEFFCILGPSGCGKTTLLRVIAGLEHAEGTLHIAPPSNGRALNFGMVFQEQGLFPWMTIRANIRFLLRYSAPRLSARESSAICTEYLEKVGLAPFAALYPHQVSGGMRQRISLARSFATEPDILLMDEPFVFVDYQTRLALHELVLKIWQDRAPTVVFVTHDIEEAVTLSDRILVLSAHPGKLRKIISVDFPRPRDVFELRKTPAFVERVNDLTQMMRAEILAIPPLEKLATPR